MTETFFIVPANPRGLLVVAAILVAVMTLVFGLLVASFRGARSSQFELSDQGLRIRGDLYGRFIAAEQIKGGRARRVDYSAEPELQLSRRTAGTSVGGYQAGWFRLKNGQKALVYMTDRNRLVYIPTGLGYSILLSVTEPDRFLQRLREIAPAG